MLLGLNPAGGFDTSILYGILTSLGLDDNAILSLDYDDPDSYNGSAQVWTDRSAAAYHFDRGLDGTAQATDPTPNAGPPGYFSFDGGDTFQSTSDAKPTAIDALHKSGAT